MHRKTSTLHARILFQYLSSAFNTIIPALMQDKLSQLSVPDSTCRWITDFLLNRKQHVRQGKHVSDSRTISTGSPSRPCPFTRSKTMMVHFYPTIIESPPPSPSGTLLPLPRTRADCSVSLALLGK